MKRALLLTPWLLLGCARQPAAPPTVAPASEPQPSPTVTYTTADGATITGDWRPAKGEPRGAVLLVPMLSRTAADWATFAETLAAHGFASLAIDLRGHGRSRAPDGATFDAFGNEQWQAAVADVAGGVAQLRGRAGEAKLFACGASIGANLLVAYAADHAAELRGLILLSPGLDYHGVRTVKPMQHILGLPTLLVATKGDHEAAAAVEPLTDGATTEFDVRLGDGREHGTRMFDETADLDDQLVDWLSAHVE